MGTFIGLRVEIIMHTKENKIWIVVSAAKDGIEAKLCDLNIAARGKDKDHLLSELTHTLTVLHEIAIELGEVPFVRFIRGTTPLEILRRESHKGNSFGTIKLQHEVAVALSAALRLSNPIDRISFIQSAA